MEWKLPEQARVHKNIPKNAFYTHAHISAKLKKEFADMVQKITWEYKLAPETIGIPKTARVEEIQLFVLELKKRVVPKSVLTAIDKSVPYPILFVGTYAESRWYAISLKVQGENRWYISEWDAEPSFRFTGMHLEAVYQGLVEACMGAHPSEEKDFNTIVATDKKRQTLEKEIHALKNKIKSEKQFNKKVALNTTLQRKMQEMAQI
jgi:hypothetical protein